MNFEGSYRIDHTVSLFEFKKGKWHPISYAKESNVQPNLELTRRELKKRLSYPEELMNKTV